MVNEIKIVYKISIKLVGVYIQYITSAVLQLQLHYVDLLQGNQHLHREMHTSILHLAPTTLEPLQYKMMSQVPCALSPTFPIP